MRNILLAITIILSCVFLYLLAMDSLCDQGGDDFILGICRVTSLLPF
ncbi:MULTISPECIES: PhoP/PhoQ regulator MgrB [Providencia]|nr:MULTISPECIES: PhoP/PhoQ regulator MgrB [Providencia]MTC57696.1 PhoP/PhoQ regulator MgrB [Providencia rustigianii]MTC59209.1 PhoP/PhoQ regulator MgrB [Providencia rustigianii]